MLSIGTPLYFGLTLPNESFYLLQPGIFAAQSVPYLLAAGLWLPWRAPSASRIGQVLASVLFLFAVLMCIAMLTGLWSNGGEMVALGFFLLAIGTSVSILFVTLVAFGVAAFRHRGISPTIEN